MIKSEIYFTIRNMSSRETASDVCSASELRELWKIRQNTAIYGCMSRTAEILHTKHKGETDSKKNPNIAWYFLITLIKCNCNKKLHIIFHWVKLKRTLRNRVNGKVFRIAHKADTFLASYNNRLDWNLDFHPNGHLVAISFKQHNSAQIRGSVRAFRTTCCVSSPQNDWACLYCLNIILSLQFIGQNATHIAHLHFNALQKPPYS